MPYFLTGEYLDRFAHEQQRIRDRYECSHEQIEVRRRSVQGGSIQLTRQCVRCGKWLGTVSRKDYDRERIDALPEYDEHLADKRYKRMGMEIEQARQQLYEEQEAARVRRDTDWWRAYKSYLVSPEWRKKRALVLKRAQYICEGCGERRAVQVHHLTYERVRDEMLFDLVAICDECHKRLHGADDEQISA